MKHREWMRARIAGLSLLLIGSLATYLFMSSGVNKNFGPHCIADAHADAERLLTAVESTLSCASWISEMELFQSSSSTFSQGTQDVVLDHIFKKIGKKHCYFAEFGFGYMGSRPILTEADMDNAAAGLNTRLLARRGWHGNYFDALVSAPEFNVTKATLTEDNIGGVFRKAGIASDIDYVSIDVDSIEVWLFRGLLKAGYRPRVVSLEYNPNFPGDAPLAVEKTWQPWTYRAVFGAGAGAIHYMAEYYGYTLVHIMKGGFLDMFYIRSDVLKLHCASSSIPSYHNQTSFLPVRTHASCEREDLLRLVHVPTAIQGNDIDAHWLAINFLKHMPRPETIAWGGAGEVCKPSAFTNLWMFPNLTDSAPPWSK